MFAFEGYIYFIAGLVISYLYLARKKGLSSLTPEVLPELDRDVFDELKTLLRTSYQRTLYLAVSFLYLGFVTLANRSSAARGFGITLTLALVIYNIPPRNRAMRMLTSSGIDMKAIKKQGIKL